jgi:Tfp pilus assembly protein PilF
MRAALALALLGGLALAQNGGTTGLASDETLETWRELLALDLPAGVLEHGRAAIQAECKLDGRAIALVARAALLADKDGFDAATKILDTAQPSPETAAYVGLERAHLAIEADRLDRALALLVPAADPTQPRWAELPGSWYEAGRALARSNQVAAAAPFLRRFVELAPVDRDAPAALHMLAREALSRGDGAMAKRCLERAEQIGRWHALWRARTIQIREHPDEPLPRIGLAQRWMQIGDAGRARTALQALIALHADNAQAHFLLGETARMQSDWESAKAAYSRALELEPEHLLARNNRAAIAANENRLADARADLERIVAGPHASEPLALNSHLQLARVLDRLGESDAAAQRYERYVELGGKEPRKP